MKIPNVPVAYRELASMGASQTHMVVLLYDRLGEDIRCAVAAMKSKDVEARSKQVNHALLILQQLQGRLDFDAGARAALQLDAFYSHVRAKLLEAQIRQSPEIMLAQAQAVAQIREGWAEVDQATSADSGGQQITSAAEASASLELVSSSWG